MQSFADQCLFMAQSILGHNIDSINPDGTISPIKEKRLAKTSQATQPWQSVSITAPPDINLNGVDLVDLSARYITQQAFADESIENGMAYAALGLLSFGPSKERNQVWERLVEQTQGS